jgi:hypothetical protein
MRGRLARLAEAAAEKGVKLMVDAEHTFFQPVSPLEVDACTQVMLCSCQR